MRHLLIVCAILFSMTVSAQHILITAPTVGEVVLMVGKWIFKDSKKLYYVQVESTADTPEQARHGAFRKAVELAVGTVILGESESDGKKLLRDDVVTYSSGYVDDYKIIKETKIGDKTKMVVDVWVSDSKIAKRLKSIGVNSGAKIDGKAIKQEWDIDQARESTDSTRQKNALRLLNTLLRDYPHRAFQPTVKKTWVAKNNGITSLFVEVDIQFSKEYIEALDETISTTRQKKFAGFGDDTGVAIKYGILKMNNTTGYYKDNTFQTTISEKLLSDTNMKLTFFGNGNPYSACWLKVTPEIDGLLFGWDSNMYTIDANRVVTRTYIVENKTGWHLSDDKFIDWVSNFTKVEALLVDSSSCR